MTSRIRTFEQIEKSLGERLDLAIKKKKQNETKTYCIILSPVILFMIMSLISRSIYYSNNYQKFIFKISLFILFPIHLIIIP